MDISNVCLFLSVGTTNEQVSVVLGLSIQLARRFRLRLFILTSREKAIQSRIHALLMGLILERYFLLEYFLMRVQTLSRLPLKDLKHRLLMVQRQPLKFSVIRFRDFLLLFGELVVR